MKICNKKAVELTPEQEEEIRIQSYFDRITPSVLRFYPDYYICGNNYCSVWAIREYAPKTQEQAILSHIADHENVTLKIYNRPRRNDCRSPCHATTTVRGRARYMEWRFSR